MVIVNTKPNNISSTPVHYLPINIKRFFYNVNLDNISEIRLRCGGPICVVNGQDKYFLTRGGALSKGNNNLVTVSRRDIDDAIEILTSSSLYAYKDDVKNGFITAEGGHRVGVCGTACKDTGFINDVSGLNYRFAREVLGCGDKVIDGIYNFGNIKNTLITSKPGGGKTTFLRDIIRQISNRGVNVSVIDERGEISGTKDGVANFDLGMCTDVFNMCSKKTGFKLMLRSMSPEVIAVDEFDVNEDGPLIRQASASGVSIFATIHCGDWKNDIPKDILRCFKCLVVLENKKIKEVLYV